MTRWLARIAVATVACAGLPVAARATMPPPAGATPVEIIEAFQDGRFALPETPAGLSTSGSRAVWRIPIILASFSDSLLRFGANDFERLLFDSTRATRTGSLHEYYRWVSGNRLKVVGRVVATVQLPETRDFYGSNAWGLSALSSPRNAYGAIRDAMRLTRATVDWSEFDLDRDGYVDMVWLVHAGIGGEASQNRNDLWSITSSMQYGWRGGTYFETDDPVPGTTDRYMRVDRFTILPELSVFAPGQISEIGVFCHEFGHAIGLPDLYDTMNLSGPLNTGPGNWSLMGSGGWGSDGYSPQYPSHLGAWPLQYLGWDRTFHPEHDTTVVLEPLARSGSIMEWWFEGESNPEHFLVEYRRQEGFDLRLPMEGLIIYHVNEAVIGQRLRYNMVNAGPDLGLVLLEADGDSDLILGRNRGDANDPFPGAMGRSRLDDDTVPNVRTFAGAVTNLALYDIAPATEGMGFRAQVRARGWLPAEDFSGAEFHPVASHGLGRRSAVDERGIGYTVGSELRTGVPQVVLRSGSNWAEAVQVSHSTSAALDPALALLPGGDAAIVWSDSRHGRGQLYYRSRIGGVWTAERRLFDLPGDCQSPAIGSDARGTLALAFLYVHSGQPEIRFVRFTYFSPFGQPVRITGTRDRPGSPAIVVDPGGIAHIVWEDRSQSPQRLWFSRYHPDSGLSVRNALAPELRSSQMSPSVLPDGAGGFHAVWQVSGPGIHELRYQRRPRVGRPEPLDTLIEEQGILAQKAVLTKDPDGGLHLVFESSRDGGVQARYKTWRPGRGWDARSTQLTFPEDGDISEPQPLPTAGGNLSVAYAAYPGKQTRFMVRRRRIAPEAPLAVATASMPALPRLALGPNPVRAGQALELFWGGPESYVPPLVEVFDLSGRRLATTALSWWSNGWRARIPRAVTGAWPSGVYYARIKEWSAPGARFVILR